MAAPSPVSRMIRSLTGMSLMASERLLVRLVLSRICSVSPAMAVRDEVRSEGAEGLLDQKLHRGFVVLPVTRRTTATRRGARRAEDPDPPLLPAGRPGSALLPR